MSEIGGPFSREGREQQFKPVELTSLEDLTQFWLIINRHSNARSTIFRSEIEFAKHLAQQSLDRPTLARDLLGWGDDKPPEYFFGTKDGDKVIATGKLTVFNL